MIRSDREDRDGKPLATGCVIDVSQRKGAIMASDTDADEVKKQHRAPIDAGRDDAVGDEEEGVALSVPSYADTGGVSDLGVDEPVVPKDVQGEHVADQPEPPVGDATPRRDRGATR